VKFIRSATKELRELSSHNVKIVAFYVFDEKPSVHHWGEDRLGTRVIDVLSKLGEFLDRGFMPDYFLAEANLFQNLSPEIVGHLKHHVHDLCASETRLMNLLQSYVGSVYQQPAFSQQSIQLSLPLSFY